MSWGENGPDTVVVLECGHEGCGHRQLGSHMNVGMSARFCPTHQIPLTPFVYEKRGSPPPRKEPHAPDHSARPS